MTSLKRSLVVLATSAALVVAATGCEGGVSIGGKSISKSEVETQAAKLLAERANRPEPKITCPGDLKGEVDATIECTLVAQGDDVAYPTTITVTSVEDGIAKFSVVVGEDPVE